jgi:hypothetical protein
MLMSCNAVLKNAYKINRPFTFKTQTAYKDYLFRTFSVSPEHIVYPDSASYNLFIEEMMKKDLDFYYGSFTNDTTEIQFSTYLQQNPACAGRVAHEVMNNLAIIDAQKLLENTSFRKYRFTSIANNTPFHLQNAGDSLQVFFIYAYGQGTFYNKYYNQIAALEKLPGSKLKTYLILTDAVYLLQK